MRCAEAVVELEIRAVKTKTPWSLPKLLLGLVKVLRQQGGPRRPHRLLRIVRRPT